MVVVVVVVDFMSVRVSNVGKVDSVSAGYILGNLLGLKG